MSIIKLIIVGLLVDWMLAFSCLYVLTENVLEK